MKRTRLMGLFGASSGRWFLGSQVLLVAVVTIQVPAQAASCGSEFPKPSGGVATAPLIVVGTAISMTSQEEITTTTGPAGQPTTGYIVHTETVLDVECVQKGAPSSPLTIRTLGGFLPDGRGMFVPNEPGFSTDERARVFLRPGAEKDVWEVVGGGEGKQTASNAGGTSPFKANECGYGAYCMGYSEWLYAQMPILFYVNVNTPDVTGEQHSVRAGMAAWENDTGSVVSLSYGGETAVQTVTCDGLNVVFWENQGPAGLAAAPLCVFRHPETRQTYLTGFDIVFNDYYLWGRNCEGNRFDIQTLAAHESGHGLGFEHVREEDEVMKPGFGVGECKRVLGPGDTAGVRSTYPGGVENLRWLLETDWPSDGLANVSYNWWNAGDTLMGDWDGDGDDTPGTKIYEFWNLRNSNSNGAYTHEIAWGQPDDVAVIGDWDNDGDDTLGIVRINTWYIKNSLTGSTNFIFPFGQADDIPIVGDWDCDGWDEPGVIRGNTWYLSNEVVPVPEGTHDLSFAYGNPTDIKVVGDWDGDGCDEPGVVRGNVWYLSYQVVPVPAGTHDISFGYGSVGDIPLSGHWTGSGTRSFPGVVRHAG